MHVDFIDRNLQAENRARKAAEKNDAWQKHTAIVRGNADIKFVGEKFIRI